MTRPLTPAQTAYQAYGAATGGLTHDGRPMPAWDQLGDRIQNAWAAAVAAVMPSTIPTGLDGNPNAVHGFTDGCPHCPDGHRAAESGTWHARVADARDGDGQPTLIRVERPGGAHVSAADAEWVRQRLNPGSTA